MTGGSGFIGRHVLNILLEQQLEVAAIGHENDSWLNSQPCTIIHADLLKDNPEELFREHQFTHLLHLAWYAEPGKYWTSFQNFHWVHATLELVREFCATGGSKVLIAGTSAEYLWDGSPCHEERTPLEPSSLYGTAKDATRRLVTALCAQNEVALSWVRIFQAYGSGENDQRLIPSILEVFKGGREPFSINTSVSRDFLHVSDVASAISTLLIEEHQGVYNVCSGVPVNLGDLIKIAAETAGSDPSSLLALSKSRDNDPTTIVGENDKLLMTGWHQSYSLERGIQEMIVKMGNR